MICTETGGKKVEVEFGKNLCGKRFREISITTDEIGQYGIMFGMDYLLKHVIKTLPPGKLSLVIKNAQAA